MLSPRARAVRLHAEQQPACYRTVLGTPQDSDAGALLPHADALPHAAVVPVWHSSKRGSDPWQPRPQTIVPESLRQRSGAPLFEDFALFLGRHWAFNVSRLPPRLAAATHFWHGTGDLQARARSLQSAAVAPALSLPCWPWRRCGVQCRKEAEARPPVHLRALACRAAVCLCCRAERCAAVGVRLAAKSLPTAGGQGGTDGSVGLWGTQRSRARRCHT